MKTKIMLPALLALALGVTAFNLTGCGKSEPSGNGSMPSAQPTPAPDTNSSNAMPMTPPANTNPPAAEIKPAPAKQYTCEMHPEIVQDTPGKCPKCGMKLVEKK